MGQGIQPFLPVGPDGLPINFSGGGGSGGGSAIVNVNVVTLAASIVKQFNLDLGKARQAESIDLKGMKVYAVTVRKLTGKALLHIGDGEALDIEELELRDCINVSRLAVTNEQQQGATLQLEVFGG